MKKIIITLLSAIVDRARTTAVLLLLIIVITAYEMEMKKVLIAEGRIVRFALLVPTANWMKAKMQLIAEDPVRLVSM